MVRVVRSAQGKETNTQPIVELSGRLQNARNLAAPLGLGPFSGIEDRIASRAAFGPVKTSMLQDWEAGRDTELAAILQARPDHSGS
jgi:hypothetical protein